MLLSITNFLFSLFRIKAAFRLLALTLFFFSKQLLASPKPIDIESVITQAQHQQLSQTRTWQVLLHYVPGKLDEKWASLVDDVNFFFSPQGKTSPQAELEASIRALFAAQSDTDAAVRCRFPARFAWLTKNLDIEPEQLPETSCKLLHTWLDNMQADGLSLIFPVSFLNSPPSMFGHTFLRFDRHQQKKPDLLAWTVNYAARTDQQKGLEFAYKGLSGGYPGKFSIDRYFSRVKEYGDIESRDIWEYQLNYKTEEIHQLLLHLWELLPVYFDYYFIDENCSYQLLALLEAARPGLNLTQQFNWQAIPADTVRAVTENPGLLVSVNYRPSNRTLIDQRLQALDADDQQLAKQLAFGSTAISDPQLTDKSLQSQAMILELAHDYAAYLEATTKRKRPSKHFTPQEQSDPKRTYELLSARNTLAIGTQKPQIKTPSVSPDQGHLSRRVGLRYGYEEPQQFLQLDFRLAYHDVTDPAGGFINGASLEFLKTALRYYPEKDRVLLESFTAVNILSAPVRNRFIKPFSWQVSVAANRYQFDAYQRPLLGDFNFALGLSYGLPWETRFSIFAKANFLISDEFNQNIALGGGGKIQLYTPITEHYLITIDAGIMQYFQGITHTSFNYSLTQRYTVSRNNALLLSVGQKQQFGGIFFDTLLSWQFYF